MLNNNPIEENRYKDIKRTPYLLNQFTYGILLGIDGNFIDSVLLNYNGYSKEFEYRRADGKIITLDSRYYFRITLFSNDFNEYILQKFDSDTITFVRGLNISDARKFYIQIHRSENILVFKEFLVTLGVNEIQNVGNTISFKYFAPKSYYYLIKEGQPIRFLLKKKSILNAMDDKKISSFVKNEKLKLSSEQDLKRVLDEYDSSF